MNKNTKIIATIGPSSWDVKTLEELALAGMNIARLNFSHGSYEEKGKQIDSIRQVSKKLDKSLAIIADLAGPKLRLGKLSGQSQGGSDPIVVLVKDQIIQL